MATSTVATSVVFAVLFLAAVSANPERHEAKRYVRLVLARKFVQNASAAVMLGVLNAETALPTQLTTSSPTGWANGADMGIGGINVSSLPGQGDGVAVIDFHNVANANALLFDPAGTAATIKYAGTYDLTIAAFNMTSAQARPPATKFFIRHAVTYKFFANTTAAQVRQLSAALTALPRKLARSSKPLTFSHGPAVALQLPAAYLSDYALVADFPKAAVYESFAEDPATLALIATALGPIMESRRAVQIPVNTA